MAGLIDPSTVGGHGRPMGSEEVRHGVASTNLDQPLFDGAEATKRDLLDYLETLGERLVRVLRERPLSVVRVRPGQAPFMQKNLPKYAPGWVRRVTVWAESSRREISYALCDDVRTLVWFGNQRAVEYHPALVPVDHAVGPTHLVLDLDPSPGQTFRHAVDAAKLIRVALANAGLAGAVKTSGATGVHVFVPIEPGTPVEDAAAATRAIAARAERIDPGFATTAFIKDDRGGKVFLDATRAGGATVVAAYSPRVRPGTPVSFPLAWTDLDDVVPTDFTVRTAPALLRDTDQWSVVMPDPQRLPTDLVAEGHTIPVPRVQAMHEGKRRARARRAI